MPDVEISGRFGRLYGLLDWPVRLVALNALWILGVLAGLVVGGLAPATLALYGLLRQYQLGRSPRMWPDFWAHWRRAVLSSQVVLGVPILTGWVVVFYLLMARETTFAFGMTVIAAGYLATLLQLPAVVTALDVPATQAWRATVIVAWRRSLESIGLAAIVIALAVAAWFTTPAALPLLFPALPSLLATQSVRRALQ